MAQFYTGDTLTVFGKGVSCKFTLKRNDLFVIPQGLQGRIPDTSWDGRGTTIALFAGDKVTLLYPSSPDTLARVEVVRA
jgi:hypothetical protein